MNSSNEPKLSPRAIALLERLDRAFEKAAREGLLDKITRVVNPLTGEVVDKET